MGVWRARRRTGYVAFDSTSSHYRDGLWDGEDHPYVGLMVALDADGYPLWRCSGTLLSPTLFLTAGHCTESPAASATIWFDADVDSGIPDNGYPFVGQASGTVHTDPLYDPAAFFLYDLGVVVLDEPIVMNEYGVLPELDQLDNLARRRRNENVSFTAVGYGLQEINPVFIEAARVRMVSHPSLIQINGGIVKDYSLLVVEQPLDRRHMLRRFWRPEFYRELQRDRGCDFVRPQRQLCRHRRRLPRRSG